MEQCSVTQLGKASPWSVSRAGPYMRVHQGTEVTASDLVGLRGSRSRCPSAPTIPSITLLLHFKLLLCAN